MLQNFTLGTFSQGASGGGGAFESIASTTLGSNQTTVSFTSIPNTYSALQLRILGRSNFSGSTNGSLRLQANSDTGSNYTWHTLIGFGSTTFAQGYASQTYSQLSYFPNNLVTTGVFGAAIIDIHDYASSSRYKTVRCFGGDDRNGGGYVGVYSGLWMSTSVISSLQMTHGDGDWLAGSVFSLYGIKGA